MNESQNNYANWKKSDSKEYRLYDFIYIEYKLVYSDRKQINGCLRMEGKITKGNEETLGGDRYVHYFRCGDGFVGLLYVKT